MSPPPEHRPISLIRLLAPLGLAAPLMAGCCPDPSCPEGDNPQDTGQPEDCSEPVAWMGEIEAGLELVARGDSGALAIEELLLYIRARALRAASEVTAEGERANLALEHATLAATIDKLARSTAYDGAILTDGSLASWTVTTGAGTIDIALADLTVSTLGVDTDLMDLSQASQAQAALDLEDAAHDVVEAWRSSLKGDRDALLAAALQLETTWPDCAITCEACDDETSIGTGPDDAEQGLIEALVDNVEQGIGLVRAADGGAESIHTTLEAIRELAVASTSEELADDERAHLQDSFETLSSEVDRLAAATRYNDIGLLDGRTEALETQVGDANTASHRVTISLADLTASTLGVDTASLDISSATGAQSSVDAIDTALDTVEAVQSGFDTTALALETVLDDLERRLE